MINLIKAPWQSSKWSPRKRNLQLLCDYILEQPKQPESMLEIGGGISTWYLNQLNFKHYVTVEVYETAIKNIQENIPSVTLVNKWEDIPKRKYQYIFVDSHVGGDDDSLANGYQREKPLIYAMENDLLKEDAILIAHDYHRMKRYRGDHTSRHGKRQKGWNDTVDKYGWKVVHEIMYRKSFGIYKRG